MSDRVPIVDERLRAVVVSLDALKQIAILVNQPLDVPHFGDRTQFAEWVFLMADLTRANVVAVRAVLPAFCTTLDAPADGGRR